MFYLENMKNLIEKIKDILNDDKKRHLLTLAIITPFLIVIIVFGVLLFKEAKGLLGSIGGSTAVVDSSHVINGGSFVLRENATEVQKEYFAELKNIYEKNQNGEYTEKDIVASTIKNFVADFYTWSNKQGQYDVGGTYYVFAPQRQTIYIQARDQFYKYINQYINKYGSDALLEVENVNVEVTSDAFSFEIDEEEYSAFKAVATWNYVQKDGNFNTSSYETKAHFVVINNYDRYEIIYLGDKEYTENE